MALFQPDRVKKIVLLAPASGIPLRIRWKDLLFSILSSPTEENIKKIARDLLGEGPAYDLWGEYFYYATKIPGKLSWPTKFTDEQLKASKTPTLLLIGEKEIIYADIEEVIERGKRLIPNFQAEVIPDAWHLLNIDQPELVNDRILRFLKD